MSQTTFKGIFIKKGGITMKALRFLMILAVCLMLTGFAKTSLASETSTVNGNSNIIVDGDIIKLDLTKLPKMSNSKISKVKAENLANEPGYKVHFELFLDKNENRKDLRVIEYNKKTNEFTVETGILAAIDSLKSNEMAISSYSNTSVTYKSWSWDPAGIVVNQLWTKLNWSYNGSSIGTYSGSYTAKAYNGATYWFLSSPVQFSKSGNSSWCQADATATFKNYDFMNDNIATYVKYTDNEAVGYPDRSASGYVDISIWGEYYWLLNYNSLLQRNY
jgi:hypothetical protein